jgi:hypothetical protein
MFRPKSHLDGHNLDKLNKWFELQSSIHVHPFMHPFMAPMIKTLPPSPKGVGSLSF